jgi:chemotaxis protein methyltransferase CheR
MSAQFDPTPQMRVQEFEQIRRMVYDFCGVDLSGKQILVGTRLSKRIRDLGFGSFGNFCAHVQQDPAGEVFTGMIDALTTNHTSFFREAQHFDLLRNVILPELPDPVPLKFWSAACSSGEEPYSIAFSLVDALGASALSRISILATDISTRVLNRARQGVYSCSQLEALSPDLARACLLKGSGQFSDQFLVKRELRDAIDFQQFNLLHDSSLFGPFHVIFCRNVMIYFDQQTQQNVVNKLISRLLPGGYLLIGHSESLNGIAHPLNYVCPATYRKSGSLGRSQEPLRNLRSLKGSR